MARTTVKVYLRGKDGELDSFIITKSFVITENLSERETRSYYLGRWFHVMTVGHRIMKCYKVEILKSE